jgi:catechol 2,3-dioxygenase-like lactoylglutathione lyase family enzyme
MLGDHELMAFVATTHPDRARQFYASVLGLRLVADEPWALVFDAHGAMLRIQKAPELHPAKHTVLGWRVPDIEETMTGLTAKGVRFERYSFLPQDELGIWTTPDGTRVAWFKDPDGNTLSLTQFAPQ